MNKRMVGTAYETLAADYLCKQGYEILERNFACRGGEIDLIAREGEYLVFVEVKYRMGADYGFPSEAVTRNKQLRIIRAARYYMMKHGYGLDTACRFDVVAVCGRNIFLYRNAFGE